MRRAAAWTSASSSRPSTPTVSSTADAPASAVSSIPSRVRMKSLRRIGASAIAATRRTMSSEPPKSCGSVTTEMPAIGREA